jgi:uncharacterized membrane protein
MTAGKGTFHGVDLGRIEDAVRTAERRTRGEIRVALARFYFWGDVTRAARRAFARLHMDRTRERNGVLIFLAPWRRRFAVIGDSGIAERVDPGFWDDLVRPMSAALRTGDINGGLIRAIEAVGDRLAALFPVNAPDGPAGAPGGAPARENQLPDSVALESGGVDGRVKN